MSNAKSLCRLGAQIVSELKEQPCASTIFLSDENGASYVLMTSKDYERILAGKLNIVEMLWMSDMVDVEFDPPNPASS